jgi:hypothetical protein
MRINLILLKIFSYIILSEYFLEIIIFKSYTSK